MIKLAITYDFKMILKFKFKTDLIIKKGNKYIKKM